MQMDMSNRKDSHIAGARWWPASEMLPCPPRSLAPKSVFFFFYRERICGGFLGIEFMIHDVNDLNQVFSCFLSDNPETWCDQCKHGECDGREFTENQDGMLTFLVGKTAKTDGGTPWTLPGMEWTACYMSCAMLESPMMLLYLGIPCCYIGNGRDPCSFPASQHPFKARLIYVTEYLWGDATRRQPRNPKM